jgi:hypothetical protein
MGKECKSVQKCAVFQISQVQESASKSAIKCIIPTVSKSDRKCNKRNKSSQNCGKVKNSECPKSVTNRHKTVTKCNGRVCESVQFDCPVCPTGFFFCWWRMNEKRTSGTLPGSFTIANERVFLGNVVRSLMPPHRWPSASPTCHQTLGD